MIYNNENDTAEILPIKSISKEQRMCVSMCVYVKFWRTQSNFYIIYS